MINFFRKDEMHCFSRRVVKNYFAHLSILKRYFSKLSHFYSGRFPSVMHNSNRLNCTLFYSHPRMHFTCLSESRFSKVIESCGWRTNLLPVLVLQNSSLNQTSCISRRENKTICLTNLEPFVSKSFTVFGLLQRCSGWKTTDIFFSFLNREIYHSYFHFLNA